MLFLFSLSKWKEKQLMTNELTVRPMFEVEFNRIWNAKTNKYSELFTKIQLSAQKQVSSDDAVLRKSIREKLRKLYQPLNDYKEINKNNADESQKLYTQLYSQAMDLNKEVIKPIEE